MVTQKKALFDVISLLRDLVIAYRTNLVVIVPKAVRTFHDQCSVHLRILTMFTGIFRVKGGGRFKATTLCFLTVVVFQCRCSSLGNQLQHHSQRPLPPPPHHPSRPNFKYPMNSPHYYSRYWKYFLHFASLFPFLLNRLATFCSWLNLYRLPNSASSKRIQRTQLGDVIVVWG